MPTSIKIPLLLSCVLLASSVNAQVTQNCETGQAEAYLSANNVRARILNNGNLFWRGSPNVYEIPKGSGKNAIFVAGIWLGAMVDGSLRVSGSTYGPYEFWPGPVSEVSQGVDCAQFDRIYSISRADFNSMSRGEEPAPDVVDWPWQLGAPVVDGDGDPTNYNLEGGDRPELLGDESLFWIMNDIGNEHSRTGNQPLGVEVHVTAFSTTHDANVHLPNTTFYRYRIINRNTEPISDAYFGFFNDVDLGGAFDDYVGSDSTLNLAFTYNADNDDEGRDGFGIAPPAIGFQIIQSPLADLDGIDNDYDGMVDEPGEMLGMTSSIWYNGGGGVQGDPGNGVDMYNYLRARWKNDQQMTLGGNGRGFSNTPTSFMYPANPPEFWSEMNTDNQGRANAPADRRTVPSVGPFDLEPGEETEILLSIITAFGNDNLDSVVKLKEAAASLVGLTALTVPKGAHISAPTSAPQILSPGNGAINQPPELKVAWSWSGPFYESEIQVAKLGGATQRRDTLTWEREWNLRLVPNSSYSFRVRMLNVGGAGPWSPIYKFSTGESTFDARRLLKDIVVVQNGLGPLIPAEGASADWRGFPGTGRPTDRQQAGPGHWIVSTSLSGACPTGNCGDYESFLARSIEASGGWEQVLPYDWEIRFEDDAFGLDRWTSGTWTPVPFSVWRTGIDTPDDPSDDVRYIAAWLDADEDGVFGLNAEDHDVSEGPDDPYTDRIYFYSPTDMTPGQGGYDSWLDAARTQGDDGGTHFSAHFPIGRLVLVNLDGGDVSDETLGAVNQLMPENGTIFRIETDAPPSPIPSAPAPEQVLEPGSISFYWSSLWNRATRIQLADNPNFSIILWETEDVSSGVVSPSFESGTYYWRIFDGGGSESVTTRFHLTTSVATEEPLLPGKFRLDPNYPNPFSTATTIGFSLELTGHVTLEVFDALGRRVAVIIDGTRPAGPQVVQFNTTGLSNGIYLYRLSSRGRQSSEIMTVIK